MIAEGKGPDYGWIMETEEKRKKAEQLGVTKDNEDGYLLSTGNDRNGPREETKAFDFLLILPKKG